MYVFTSLKLKFSVYGLLYLIRLTVLRYLLYLRLDGKNYGYFCNKFIYNWLTVFQNITIVSNKYDY